MAIARPMPLVAPVIKAFFIYTKQLSSVKLTIKNERLKAGKVNRRIISVMGVKSSVK
jgi:hypothetical protein